MESSFGGMHPVLRKSVDLIDRSDWIRSNERGASVIVPPNIRWVKLTERNYAGAFHDNRTDVMVFTVRRRKGPPPRNQLGYRRNCWSGKQIPEGWVSKNGILGLNTTLDSRP